MGQRAAYSAFSSRSLRRRWAARLGRVFSSSVSAGHLSRLGRLDSVCSQVNQYALTCLTCRCAVSRAAPGLDREQPSAAQTQFPLVRTPGPATKSRDRGFACKSWKLPQVLARKPGRSRGRKERCERRRLHRKTVSQISHLPLFSAFSGASAAGTGSDPLHSSPSPAALLCTLVRCCGSNSKADPTATVKGAVKITFGTAPVETQGGHDLGDRRTCLWRREYVQPSSRGGYGGRWRRGRR